MANQTTNLDLIEVNQAQKEVVVNELLDAASPSTAYGRRASTCVGLTWGYYGGVVPVSDVPTEIANGTVSLTASTTNYIYRDAAGAVQVTTALSSDWPGPLPSGEVALYEAVTDTDSVTDYTDLRLAAGVQGATGATGATGANWTVEVNAQTGTSYTLQASDNGKTVTLDNGSAIALTVPSGLGANFCVKIAQLGAGQVTITGSGATVNAYSSLNKLAGQYAGGTLIAYVADTFLLEGNLA